MVSPLLLDWTGDADVPAGARLVASEVEWLRVASYLQAPNAQEVMVRGKALCEWAFQWWTTSGGTCEEVHSPVDTLLSLSPDLSRDEAKGVVNELGETWRSQAGTTWKLHDVLSALFPSYGEVGSGWRRIHNDLNRLEIAASWLLWLEQQKVLSPSHAKLIEHQAELWREQGEDSRDLFPATPGEAHAALEKWLGVEAKGRGSFALREAFPIPIPSVWKQTASSFYARDLTQYTGDDDSALWAWWRRLETSNAPSTLCELAADTLAQVVRQHPRFLSDELLVLLESSLSTQTLGELRRLKPPATPGALDQVIDQGPRAIFEWVTKNYLPFRAYACESENANALVTSVELAKEFGAWFLKFYADAISGKGRSFLQMHRADELRTSRCDELTLWVIADGLGWEDARTLSRLINENCPRFSLCESTPLFATIPTITSIAKPSVRWSAPPRQVREGVPSKRRESSVPGHKEAAHTLSQGQAGELVVWTPLEPDKTYHQSADANILRGRVAGALEGLAQNIVEAALAAPIDLPFKLVITTDHGRLLGSSPRTHAIPHGMTGHGRAAYGTSKPDRSDETGVFYLEPDSYGNSLHVVIATDEESFVTNASEGAKGHTGTEKFPHGGVFPEEVVVPWLVFERDAAPLQVEAILSGKGRAGNAASATLRLTNSSTRALTVQNIEIFSGSLKLGISFAPTVVSPFSTTEMEVLFESWPEPATARSLTAHLGLRAPDGRLIQSAATVHLEVEALQTRQENILDDLLL